MTTRTVANPLMSPWVFLGVPGLLVLALYAPLFPGLVQEWAEFPTLSHGFAIPLIAAYLIWSRRDRLTLTPIEPSLWGLPVFLLGLGSFVLGRAAEEVVIARISIPVTLLGLVLLLAGPKMTKGVWFGVAYLAFMVPPPYITLKTLTTRSRLVDATVATHLLGWLGVPVHRDGVLLHLPNIVLEVADDCSSIPALAALLSLGTVYASLVERPIAVRAALILMTVPLAIGANMVRITLTAAAAYYMGLWTLGGFFHKFSGTVNFLLTFWLLVILDVGLVQVMRWRRR
jgi:exosortase